MLSQLNLRHALELLKNLQSLLAQNHHFSNSQVITTHNMDQTTPKEQARVALLMSINEEILFEINRLQSVGQGGAVNPQQALQLRNAGQSDKMASDDYVQLLRRVFDKCTNGILDC